jgi:predicted ArsR family transcriptional regulator
VYGVSTPPTSVRLDHRQVRVLAHPLRARLLGQLRLDGPATATRLAEVLGTNTGATSYHLRQLAEVGLVAEAPGAGRGRERWWRAAHDVTSWYPSDYDDDPDARAALRWFENYAVRRLAENAEAWLRAAPDFPAAWRDASAGSDYLLTMDAAQLRALVDELDAVVERHRAAAADHPAPDARQVQVYVHAHPRVGMP